MINWNQPPTKPLKTNWKETKFVPKIKKSKYSIYNGILETIGDTPLIRMNNITKSNGIECEILGKCEFMNPGGSIKDRIAVEMIEAAEKSGKLKPGGTIIEPTSGISLAMCAAYRGYKMVATMQDKCSYEKELVLKSLNCQIIRTPNDEPIDSPMSHIGKAWEIYNNTENSVVLDQYSNPYNPLTHYHYTALEILETCDYKIDMLVIGAGTCGSLTGIGSKVKEHLPNCKIIAVDPVGSTLANLNDASLSLQKGPFEVEGLGKHYKPGVCDSKNNKKNIFNCDETGLNFKQPINKTLNFKGCKTNKWSKKFNEIVMDEWVKVEDKDSFLTARQLICQEGLLIGGSSGAIMWAAMEMAKKYKYSKKNRIVVILPDSIRNYL
ncbi:hypothetical protein A3Q56_01410 [Intoshia linei]|uniref:cystathionine beta-synthase n=1 Tax=Intoshia linei TaxID=1819745 RepID=A0A177B961_9BILA|nr:hypothetical protein A3Q56_01410 [Intoshia linei]